MTQCESCLAPVVDPSTRRCRRCLRAASASTPLREWRERTGVSLEQLARTARIARSTVLVVAAGRPASGPVALRLSEATGIDAAVLLRGAGTRWT